MTRTGTPDGAWTRCAGWNSLARYVPAGSGGMPPPDGQAGDWRSPHTRYVAHDGDPVAGHADWDRELLQAAEPDDVRMVTAAGECDLEQHPAARYVDGFTGVVSDDHPSLD
jgi:hypothetical protein